MGITEIEKADLFEYLPRHRGKYDMIIANDIIEHLKKDEVLRFLDLIMNSLRPKGRFFYSNTMSLFRASTAFLSLPMNFLSPLTASIKS